MGGEKASKLFLRNADGTSPRADAVATQPTKSYQFIDKCGGHSQSLRNFANGVHRAKPCRCAFRGKKAVRGLNVILEFHLVAV